MLQGGKASVNKEENNKNEKQQLKLKKNLVFFPYQN